MCALLRSRPMACSRSPTPTTPWDGGSRRTTSGTGTTSGANWCWRRTWLTARCSPTPTTTSATASGRASSARTRPTRPTASTSTRTSCAAVWAEHPAFDADGNQTDIVTGTGRWLVEYNGENRSVRWTRPADGTILEMSYDSRGRRVRFNADTFDLLEEDISYYADVLADLERTPFELYLFLDNAPVTNEERLGLGQVGSPIRCGNCLICIDNDTSSGDGNGYKIHWNCGKHGRASTCRGGLSAQWPSGLPSHGNLAKVPPNIRKCLKGTRWELKELPVSIPASKPNCCRRSVIYTAEPSDGGTLVGTPEMATVSLCLGTFMVVIAIVLLPVGI